MDGFSEKSWAIDANDVVAVVSDMTQDAPKIHVVPLDNATDLTPDSGVDDTHPAISPDGARIAFRSERDGGGVFVMGATGESVRRLTDFGYHPAWSPDGEQIAVSAGAYKGCGAAAHSRIWIVDVADGEKRPLEGAGETSYQPSWSPDGRSVAYVGVRGASAVRGVWLAPAAGGVERRIAADPMVETPAWSPSGRALHFASGATGVTNLWRATLAAPRADDVLEAMTAGVDARAVRPTLSRDGRLLAFAGERATINVVRYPFDPVTRRVAGPAEPLTRGANTYDGLDVSPDGAWVVMTNGIGLTAQEDLFVMRADGTGLRRLTDDAARDRCPPVTHDSRRVLAMSERSGRYEMWSVAIDGSGLSQVTRTKHAAPYPVPSPRDASVVAGRKLVFDGDLPFAAQEPRPLPAPGEGLAFEPSRWRCDGSEIVGHVTDDQEGFRLEGLVAYAPVEGRFREISRTAVTWPQPLADGRSYVGYTRKLLPFRPDELRLLDAPSGRTSALLPPGTKVVSFVLTCDERWLYAAVREGDGDVWLAVLE